MRNIGIVVPHLGSSQIGFTAIKAIEKIEDNKVIFFENLVPSICSLNCAKLCVNELTHFHGTLITTNIDNTILGLNLCNRKKTKVIFYVWDLEWLRKGKNNYLYNLQAYKDANVLIARSIEHAGPIENYSNRKPLVIESFNLEEILRY